MLISRLITMPISNRRKTCYLRNLVYWNISHTLHCRHSTSTWSISTAALIVSDWIYRTSRQRSIADQQHATTMLSSRYIQHSICYIYANIVNVHAFILYCLHIIRSNQVHGYIQNEAPIYGYFAVLFNVVLTTQHDNITVKRKSRAYTCLLNTSPSPRD